MSELPLQNFGRNIAFIPTRKYVPANEAEVLEILNRHRGESIRAVGRLHSWSEAAATDGILLDLCRLNSVTVETDVGGQLAVVGAGCQIKHALSELRRHGMTTPSVGLISEQTIAGAISTGTHGSGRHSLSHYSDRIRLAVYDRVSGRATVVTIDSGDDLRAARCALGALGIVLSVAFRPKVNYRIEEHVVRYSSLDQVLAAEETYPLQQFFLIPWLWEYYGQHRRETDAPRSKWAGLYQAYWYLGLDVAWHLALRFLVRTLRSSSTIRGFFRHVLPQLILTNWRVVDRADRLLVIEHELFRHIEIEVFVRRSQLPAALAFVQQTLSAAAGCQDEISPETRHQLAEAGLLTALDGLRGKYLHHYPICVRKVLADDTLMSPAAADDSPEPWYTMSFISYERPKKRDGFFRFADFLAAAVAVLFNGRPHWGKVCPLSLQQIERVYPRFQEFRDVCLRFDPEGRFSNGWLANLLGRDRPNALTRGLPEGL